MSPPSSSAAAPVSRRPVAASQSDSKRSANPTQPSTQPPSTATARATRAPATTRSSLDRQHQHQPRRRDMGATKTKAPPSPNAVKVSPAPRAADNNDYGFQDSTVTDCDYEYADNGDDRKRAAKSTPKNHGTNSAISSTDTDSDNTINKVAAAKPPPGTSPTIMSTPPRPKTASAGDTGDNNPKFRQARPAHPSLTSSQSRVESFKSHGLSELSKQIRIAHAKNTAMASEIERLERQ